MTNLPLHPPVAVFRCPQYDCKQIQSLLVQAFEQLQLNPRNLFYGKKVLLKPNIVHASSPDQAVCTHPAVVEAAAHLVQEAGGQPLMAESPGGPYTKALLQRVCQVSGLADAARRAGMTINSDFSSVPFSAPDGTEVREFEILRPIAEAEVILNLSKMKTHTLAGISCASKNLFGAIPGVQKFGLHARFRDQKRFLAALNDLCEALCKQKKIIHICDAVVGMEGNGPTAGKPRAAGFILISENPWALDTVAAKIMGISPTSVPMLTDARTRGLVSEEFPTTLGVQPTDLPVPGGFLPPDTQRGKKFEKIPSFLMPRPMVSPAECIGCAHCASICPAHAIVMHHKLPQIRRRVCIRCFCCQELCPRHAITIHKNLLFRLIP